MRLDALDHLARGAAGRDDVFHDQAALTGAEREAPPQAHHAALSFGEQCAHAECPRHLVRDEDAADRRCQHGLHAVVAERRCQRRAEGAGILGMLQHERRLEIDVGVQARGETEVATQECAALLVTRQRRALGGHVRCRHAHMICHSAHHRDTAATPRRAI